MHVLWLRCNFLITKFNQNVKMCTVLAWSINNTNIGILKMFWRTSFLSWGDWLSLFWSSGDAYPGWLCASSSVYNRFPRFTSGVTPADLLVVSKVVEPFDPHICIQILMGLEFGTGCDNVWLDIGLTVAVIMGIITPTWTSIKILNTIKIYMLDTCLVSFCCK